MWKIESNRCPMNHQDGMNLLILVLKYILEGKKASYLSIKRAQA